MRAATARMVVAYIQNAAQPDDACARAIEDLRDFGPPLDMGIVCVSQEDKSHAGVSTRPGTSTRPDERHAESGSSGPTS